MRALRSLSSFALSLLLVACSSDDDGANTNGGSSQTGVNSNNPAGASGAGGGTSGGAGTSTSGSEGGSAGVGLDPGNGAGAGNSTGGSTMAAAGNGGAAMGVDAGNDTTMSFFVTSRGGLNGGDFDGIEGADALCEELAAASSPALAAKTWRAYLSTTMEDARERIGQGPWRNFNGRIIANDLEQLHDQSATGSLNETWPLNDTSIALDETGAIVPSGGGNVLHDILTGTQADGTLAEGLNCGDWLLATGEVTVGHSNRAGGGVMESWSSAHDFVQCAPATANGQQGTVSAGGGRGSIYCFAAD